MTMSRGSSSSSAAPKEKKSKKMTTSPNQGGSPSSATPEKNAEDADELGGARLIVISWVFSQL